MFNIFDITIAVLLSCAMVFYVRHSSKTNARKKALDKKMERDQIIAARKRMKKKKGNLSEEEKAMLSTQRDKWFSFFLYAMIAVIAYLIINNIVMIISYDGAHDITGTVTTFTEVMKTAMRF